MIPLFSKRFCTIFHILAGGREMRTNRGHAHVAETSWEDGCGYCNYRFKYVRFFISSWLGTFILLFAGFMFSVFILPLHVINWMHEYI